MTPHHLLFAAFGLCLLAPLAFANDGFGGLSATGLTFSNTDKVVMEQEDLFIGIDKVRVSYLFRNTGAQDVTGEVIFPLPPIPISQMQDSMWNLPDDPGRNNLVNFRAEVYGVEVPVAIDRLAVIEPDYVEGRAPSEQYDTPGRDVTADLARFGIPLSVDIEKVTQALLALDPEAQKKIDALGLAEYQSDQANGPADFVFPSWAVVLRYHWTQTFRAGAVVRVDHEYENHPEGGLFIWSNPPEFDSQSDAQKRYCIDAATSRAMSKASQNKSVDGTDYAMGTAYNIDYVLRTANSWAGPIGKFRLTLDKGDARNVISLCIDGIKKTGPTTFVVEKTNFTPMDDLQILVLLPTQNQ